MRYRRTLIPACGVPHRPEAARLSNNQPRRNASCNARHVSPVTFNGCMLHRWQDKDIVDLDVLNFPIQEASYCMILPFYSPPSLQKQSSSCSSLAAWHTSLSSSVKTTGPTQYSPASPKTRTKPPHYTSTLPKMPWTTGCNSISRIPAPR